MKLRVFDTATELFQAAAEEFVSRATCAVRERGRFCAALAGGSTPRGLFTLLASGAFPNMPWDKTFLFWGDERHVPPDNPDSNYRMTKEALLSKISIPADQIFRIPGEQPADLAAANYEETLRRFFGAGIGQFPRFDLAINGMGSDGHTASLFPGTPALNERVSLVAAPWIEKFKSYRITLTFPVFNHSACVLFMVTGKEKASALHAIYEGNKSGLPAGRIRPSSGESLWFVDREAAGGLKDSS
jgi:6-phosphogluconolactonase